MMKYILIYYTAVKREPVIYGDRDAEDMFAEIVRLTQSKAKFAIYRIGECVGDFS
jgi:hypothetical protein